MSDLKAVLFDLFGWPSREGPGRVDANHDLVWGDIDNPAWDRATKLVAEAAPPPLDGLDVERLGRAIVEHRAKFWATEPCVAECARDIGAIYAALREGETP